MLNHHSVSLLLQTSEVDVGDFELECLDDTKHIKPREKKELDDIVPLLTRRDINRYTKIIFED